MSSFINLKHIPCPAGDSCTAFQCLFGHKNSKDVSPTPPPATAIRASTPDDKPVPSQGPPRKRLRVDGESVAGSTPVAGPHRLSKTPSKPVTSDLLPDGSLSTRPRSISPPPLKRKAPHSSPSPSAARKLPTIHKSHIPDSDSPRLLSTPKSDSKKPTIASALTASSTTPTIKEISQSAALSSPPISSTPATPATQPRKPETLKPRFLHKAPSSFETRFKLIKLLQAEFVRLNNALGKELKSAPAEEARGLILSDQEIIWKVLDVEERAAIDKPSIYNNVLRNLIMQYKRMAVRQWREERVAERATREHKSRPCRTQGLPKKIVTGLTPEQEVQILPQLITPINELSNHGYVSSAPTDAEIQKAREGLKAADGWEKCDRCTKRFQVIPERRDEDGSLTTGGKCTYHWGKQYIPERQPGDRTRVPKRYRCCGQEVGDAAGCTDAPHHVFKASDPKRLATVLEFAETPANPDAPANRGVCFDCEMCYTVHGLELVRLTATSWPSGEELLDVLVHPVGQVLDLNSRFSGVWPDDLAKAIPWTDADSARLKLAPKAATRKASQVDKPMKVVDSPKVARDLLFSLISPETPLIGHGLENDLNSVRIIHPTIIDTVLLYPHKHGLPFRYGLKMLMDNLLNRKIQVETGGKVQGHDSAEDARAAGELVHLKVMEKWRDMRYSGWTLDETSGGFIPPPDPVAPPGLTVEFLEAAH